MNLSFSDRQLEASGQAGVGVMLAFCLIGMRLPAATESASAAKIR